MRVSRISFALAAFIILLNTNIYPLEKVYIRFSPPAGDKLTYALNTVIQSSGSNVMGKDISMAASAKGDLVLDIIRVTANNVYTDLGSSDLLVTVQSPMSTRSLNLAPREKEKLKVVFNRAGGIDKIGNTAALKRKNLMNFSVIQIIRNYFPTLPTKPVAAGEYWTENKRMVVPFQGIQLEVLLNVKYTLDSIITTQAGKEASISAEYTVSLKGKRSISEGKVFFEGKGTGSGYIHYLVSRGYFTEYRLDYQIESEMVIKNKDHVLMQLPVSVTANASLELLK